MHAFFINVFSNNFDFKGLTHVHVLAGFKNKAMKVQINWFKLHTMKQLEAS